MRSEPISHLPPGALDALGLDRPCALPPRRVAPLETPRGKVWIKRHEAHPGRFRHAALAGISKLIPVPILRPGADSKSADTLIQQAEQNKILQQRGLPVADIIYADADCLILADAGISLDPVAKALSKDPGRIAVDDIDRDALHAILLQMTEALADLHASDLAHGRPKIRDFAWQREGFVGDGKPASGRVTLLDLEERPWTVMPMAAAQARDVFLWMLDLCSLHATRGIAVGAMTVLDRTMSDETRRELRKLTKLLAIAAPPARLITKTPLGNREITGSLGAFAVLKSCVSPQDVTRQKS